MKTTPAPTSTLTALDALDALQDRINRARGVLALFVVLHDLEMERTSHATTDSAIQSSHHDCLRDLAHETFDTLDQIEQTLGGVR